MKEGMKAGALTIHALTVVRKLWDSRYLLADWRNSSYPNYSD